MRTFWLGVMAAMVLGTGVMGFMPAEAGAEGFNEDVVLTEEQQQEMAALHRNAMEIQKEIVNKYVEFGVFTEEKGEQIISRFEKGYEALEKNGFIPNWNKRHGDKDE